MSEYAITELTEVGKAREEGRREACREIAELLVRVKIHLDNAIDGTRYDELEGSRQAEAIRQHLELARGHVNLFLEPWQRIGRWPGEGDRDAE